MKIIRFDKIDSTSNFLKIYDKKENYLCIITNTQFAGRGRRGNRWVSEDGMALFSFCVDENEIGNNEWSNIPLLTGISVIKAILKYEKLDLKIKWPNDIYVNNKKLGGILVEKVNEYFIIGVGININNKKLEGIEDIAISLANITKKEYKIDNIICDVVNEFKNVLKVEWQINLDYINSLSFLQGKEVEIETENGNIIGEVLKINLLGELEIQTVTGKYSLNSGNIHILKK